MIIISAHDTTVGPMAAILIDDNRSCGQPAYASFINLELLDNDSIQIRFYDGS